jgi:hypothetical protein
MSASPMTMVPARTSVDDATAATLKLLAYCRAHDWAGHDPYDALNSRMFTALPLLNSRLPRLALTQALKRSPVNIRGLALVPPTQNPKALALFLAASLRLARLGMTAEDDLVRTLTERLIALRSPATDAWCWGYSFPWQTRTLVVPRGVPNLVCTSFVGNALLDAYVQRGEPRLLSMAVSAAAYILNELYWTDGGDGAGFAYPLPSLRTQVHNANFLGAAYLCRVFGLTGDEQFLGPALRVARYSAAQQRPDGSWAYGEAPTQDWIDNFHTGYNLCALRSIGSDLDTAEFEPAVRRGFTFYREHFFRADGAPRYFHDRTYPIDVHCVAQSILTLLALGARGPGGGGRAPPGGRWGRGPRWGPRGVW